MVVQKIGQDLKDSNKSFYSAFQSAYLETKYNLPQDIKMQAIYLGKNELFSNNKNEAYCYVVPNSLVQNVFIHLVKKNEGGWDKVTLKMEPFLGEFEMYDGFIKPEK